MNTTTNNGMVNKDREAKYALRMPMKLKDRLYETARANHRTIVGQINLILEEWFKKEAKKDKRKK